MPQKKGLVAAKGKPLTLLGQELKVGDKAPDFQVVDNSMNPVKLSDFKGKVVLLSVTPSVDTGTCDLQAKRFNKMAREVAKDVVILNISMDLPFALARWCGATGSDKIKTLSDYQEWNFGLQYGLLIKETRLLARSVWIINKNGVIQYIQIVPEVPTEPDYADAFGALKKLVG
ncbi:MAG: thiol peroxidase [bacterium]|nr:MAG: thiol peroxidase [bacterium]